MENQSNSNNKWVVRGKLAAALAIDIIGTLSVFIPVLGDVFDYYWGPFSVLAIWALFPKRWGMALMGGVEEMLPFLPFDFVPSASIAWFFTYVVNKD